MSGNASRLSSIDTERLKGMICIEICQTSVASTPPRIRTRRRLLSMRVTWLVALPPCETHVRPSAEISGYLGEKHVEHAEFRLGRDHRRSSDVFQISWSLIPASMVQEMMDYENVDF